jgi:hypothetical protein
MVRAHEAPVLGAVAFFARGLYHSAFGDCSDRVAPLYEPSAVH